MNIAIMFVKHFISRLVRRAYWLWRLQHARIGSNVSIAFPLKLEGSGSFSIGDNSTIKLAVQVGVGLDSKIELGQSCCIDENVTLLTGEGARITFGDNCRVGRFTSLWTNSEWEIGAGSAINSFCAVFAREEGKAGRLVIGSGSNIGDNSTLDICDDLIIGNDVALGGHNIIYTHDHLAVDNGPAWKGGVKRGRVVINDGAWIGAGVIILPGVTIGKNAVVAAGAVVTKDIPEGALYGGIPARPLK